MKRFQQQAGSGELRVVTSKAEWDVTRQVIGEADLIVDALLGTGFASMAMEVVWVRQFTPLLGNLVYAFALILASYLLATLTGSLLYRRWSASLPEDGPPAVVWMTLVLAAMLPAVAADPRLPTS